jgi:hypothetical protein
MIPKADRGPAGARSPLRFMLAPIEALEPKGEHSAAVQASAIDRYAGW